MSGDARREQILATAVNLFSKHGFSGTTTKQIATASGVSEAMVFRHFATKDELYRAILDNKSCQGDMQFPWSENTELADAMRAKDDHAVFYNLALHAMNKQQSDEGFMRLLFYSALEDHALAQGFFNEFVSRVYEFIGEYIRTRQADGAFRNVDPRIVVRAFLGMIIHHSLNNILWDKKRAILDISNEEASANFTDILLKGISK
jgi:TetR/AcrR family transcriptional regulator